MKKIILLCCLVLVIVIVYSCKKNVSTSSLGTVSLSLPATPDIYYDSTFLSAQFSDSLNKEATLGRVLFYDGHLSVNNSISCGSCHKQSIGFSDNVALSKGVEGQLTKRNTLAINTLTFNSGALSSGIANLFWDGREDNVFNLSLRPLTNHVEMGITDPGTLPAKLAALPYYNQLFLNAYGDNTITVDRISKAIGLFINSIQSFNTRFDFYNRGIQNSMTAQEIYGLNLFNTKYNCATCHNTGTVFPGGGGGYGSISGSFKDIGLDPNYTDLGRGAITGNDTDNGTFLIPDLHNVAITGPYMHDGRYKTLGDVIDHYSHGIANSPNLDPLLKDANGNARNMNISDDEKAAIIAFLNTLTDYKMLTDNKFSNPFNIN